MKIEDGRIDLGNDHVPWRLITPDKASQQYCVLWLQGWLSSMDFHLEGVKRMAGASGVAFATMDFAGHGLHTQPPETTTNNSNLQKLRRCLTS